MLYNTVYSDIHFCIEVPCSVGEYSVTGYAPCKKCPVNFYQDQTTQDMCQPCRQDQITQGTGATRSTDCLNLSRYNHKLN